MSNMYGQRSSTYHRRVRFDPKPLNATSSSESLSPLDLFCVPLVVLWLGATLGARLALLRVEDTLVARLPATLVLVCLRGAKLLVGALDLMVLSSRSESESGTSGMAASAAPKSSPESPSDSTTLALPFPFALTGLVGAVLDVTETEAFVGAALRPERGGDSNSSSSSSST
jgi:hypothetical protein